MVCLFKTSLNPLFVPLDTAYPPSLRSLLNAFPGSPQGSFMNPFERNTSLERSLLRSSADLVSAHPPWKQLAPQIACVV